MQAERDWLVRFVFPQLREALLLHRIHLLDVDLRWGVTSEQDAFGVCREVIDECRPRFLCMLGGRYGWVPPGRDHSITADEIRYGVLDRLDERGSAFFYFRDPRATAAMIEQSVGEFREPSGSASEEKLVALKRAIECADLRPFTYAARWDEALRRLTGLETFGERIFADLMQSLRDDPALADRFAETAAASDEFADESAAMEAFIEERVERFVIGNRQSLLDALFTFATSDGAPNVFVVTGDPGSGKSALLAKFHQLLGPPANELLVPHFIGASAGSTDLRRMLRRLCHALAPGESAPDDVKELIECFRRLLAGSTQRVVLIFDALNQLDPADSAHYLHWLPQELLPHVRIVASTPAHQTLEILRRRGARVETLPALSEPDAHEIVEAFLHRYAKRLDSAQLASLLAKPDAHLPLFLLSALEELRTLGTYEEITARIRGLPGDTRALFAWILNERLANDSGFRSPDGHPCGAALVEKFAACLGVSRQGLSQSELITLLDPGDPLGNVAALLRLLRPYLMHRGELLDFFHGQFRDAAVAEYLHTDSQREAAHRALTVLFHDVADPGRNGEWRGDSAHALSELVHHESKARVWLDLIATLENISFLEAKVAYGMALDLIRDFAEATDALPQDHPRRRILCLLGVALGSDIQFIARHAHDYPQALFQCLWNSCWWYDCPEAAKHFTRYSLNQSDKRTCPPWNMAGEKLYALLEQWLARKIAGTQGFLWIRSLRPPSISLDNKYLFKLRAEAASITDVAFSPDEKYVVAGCADSVLHVWDMRTGQMTQTLRAHEMRVNSVDVSPDGRRIISASNDGTLRLWDAEYWHEIAVFRGHTGYVNCVRFFPDGQRIASGGLDGTLRIWRLTNFEQEYCYATGKEAVLSVAISSNGRAVASGAGCLVMMWIPPHTKAARIFKGRSNSPKASNYNPGEATHHKQVTALVFSPDGKTLYTGSLDETIRGWCVATGKEIYHSWTEGGALGAVTCLQWQPGTECFVSSHESFNSYGYSAPSIAIHAAGRHVRPEIELQRSVNKIAVSSTGRFLAAASCEDVMVFDLRRGSTSNVTLKRPELCLGVRFSNDGSCICWHKVAIGVGAFGIGAWNLSTWEEQDLEECNPPEDAYSSQHYAWLSIRGESVLKSLADNRIVARYPVSLENPASHPNLPMWAQCSGTYVEVVSLDIAGTIAQTLDTTDILLLK